jgi:small subunit ribosomal protein S1
MSKQFLPEGMLIDSSDNRISIRNMSSLQEAMCQGKILEARAVICDSRHNLVIDFGGFKGLIPREEGALGIEDGTTRDIAIISRVNKPVCFKVTGFERCSDGRTMPLLSRRAAQVSCLKGYLAKLVPGDIISARITHLEPFGCFVDIGCGIPSLIPIDAISVSRISHPSDRFVPGQEIRAVVRSIDPGAASA